MKPKLIIFASGSSTGGGSGFEKLCLAMKEGKLRADIVAVVSNHENGGVRKHAENFGVHFIHFAGPWTAEKYQEIVKETGAEYVGLSGWLKLVRGLDPKKTFNIHPGPLPMFGGKGMYGHHVHEAVMKAYKEGTVTHSAVTMHFVTDEYDKGPTILNLPIEISPNDTAETLGKRVNEQEHAWQWKITDMVVNGEIYWDGKDAKSVFGAILNN
jgi:folate-dependent phosphoribosylglycinamide formyltransferase PurN